MFGGLPMRFIRPASLAALVGVLMVPLIGLPYTADDTGNRNWPLIGVSEAVRSAIDMNDSWMRDQGRFFPGGALYGIGLWNILDSRVAYMTYLALVGILLIALVTYVTWRVSRSARIAALAAVTLGTCMQVRLGPVFDGVASFGGLVVFTLVLTLGATLLAAYVLRGGSRWLAIPIALSWGWAITSYEVSLLMLPALLVVLIVTAPAPRVPVRWAWALAPLVVPAVSQAAITAFLRSRASGTGVAYTIDLEGPVGTTFGKQFTAALPFAQQGWFSVPLNATLSVMLVIALGVPVFLAWQPWRIALSRVPLRVPTGLIIAGGWMWVVPSLLAAITVRWQAELGWGTGYIYVVYEFVGFTLVIVGLAMLLSRRVDRPWARVALSVLFACMVAGCAVSAGVNIFAVGTIVPGAQGPG